MCFIINYEEMAAGMQCKNLIAGQTKLPGRLFLKFILCSEKEKHFSIHNYHLCCILVSLQPLSELKRRVWGKICLSTPTDDSDRVSQPNFEHCDNDEDRENAKGTSTGTAAICESAMQTPENKINEQLQRLKEMVDASGGSRRRSVKKFEVNEYAAAGVYCI